MDIVIKDLDDSFAYVEYKDLHVVLWKVNGYINCSKLCKLADKRFSSWKRLSASKALLEVKKISREDQLLIRVYRGSKKVSVSGFYLKQELVQYVTEWMGNGLVDSVTELINAYNLSTSTICKKIVVERPDNSTLCPFINLGRCYYGKNCKYLHGDRCSLCGLFVLHPLDGEQRSRHASSCLESRKHLTVFERSNDKQCGICMERIYEKDIKDQFFGLLSNCCHVFCFCCIFRWMYVSLNTATENTCPECRTVSDLIIPNRYWIGNKYEKKLFIDQCRNKNKAIKKK
ncbi:ORF-96 [Teiidae poxvirus 1]|nr:ORF-96 [Teiidae poxvirus 1]